MLNAEPIRRRARTLLRTPAASHARSMIDDALDSVRLRIDHTGLRAYQPIPLLGRDHGRRTVGTRSRWNAMLPLIRAVRPQHALDIGCNAGWFTLELAALGVPTIGVENDPPMYRTAIFSSRRAAGLKPGVLVMRVEPETTRLLPRADCVLLLSIWHHMVRDFGLVAADRILGDVWANTGKVLFFETGEEESIAPFGLPRMEPSPRAWLTHHLERVCRDGYVVDLGTHVAFGADGAACLRTLFAVLTAEAAQAASAAGIEGLGGGDGSG